MIDFKTKMSVMLRSGAAAAACDVDPGDTAWIVMSFLLVFLMFPGLILFEAGLLRAKNTISVAIQICTGTSILSLMWYLFGFSLVFGPDQGGVIGSLTEHALFINTPYDSCLPNYSTTIPGAVFACFQMMFAVIAPLLMTGAFAERLKFKAFLFITLMWELFIYYPVAHWIWGGGWLAQQGVLDFAGGITIHTTAGISGVVICVLLGKRKGFSRNHGEFPPSNMLAACLGAMLLWIGWFGFNAGSALSAGRSAVAAIVSTHIAASASAAVWLFAHWGRYGGRTSLVALLNGAVAGLAGVTPASGYISSLSALVLGVILGFASLVTVSVFKSRLHIDDALDVIGVHGVTGIVGSIFIGFAAQNGGLAYTSNGTLLGWQCIAVLCVVVYSAIITYTICKVADFFCDGLRVSDEDEKHGLDRGEHTELGHHFLDFNIISDAAAHADAAAGGHSHRESVGSVDDNVGSLQSRSGQIDALRTSLLEQLPAMSSGKH